MSDQQQVSVTARLDITGLLLLAFIVLKLTHVIDWSWWWVLAPLWVPALLALGLIVTGLGVIAFGRRRRRR